VTWITLASGRELAGWGYIGRMFFFFSNRLGCLGSIVVSVIATLILIALFSR
jgi:hypothetical protein